MPVAVKKAHKVVDSDQEMDDAEEIQDQEVDNEEAGEGDAGEGEEGEEEEYEIEAILEARRGVFPEGRVGYLVKWKGFDTSQNSWVAEEDANADDLIKEFWHKNKKEKRGRKLDIKPKNASARAAQSSAKARSSDDEAPPPPQKRGRQSKAAAPQSISDDEEEDVEVPKPKKARQSTKKTTEASSSRKSKPPPPPPQNDDEEMVEEEEEFSDLKKLKSLDDWSQYVERIDTIERVEDGTLFVYFILNNKGKSKVGDQHRCRERSDICRKKMPQMLLDFYEENLRWRKVDGENGDS